MPVHWTDYPERVEKFGHLLSILETLDRDNTDDVFTGSSFDNESDESAYKVDPHPNGYLFNPRLERMPGLERVLTLLEQEGHYEGVSLNLLRALRGRVTSAAKTDRASVDDLTFHQIADILEGKHPTGDSSSVSDRSPVSNEPPASPRATGSRRYTLGELVHFLDGVEQSRVFHRLNMEEQVRRDPIGAAVNEVRSAALRWQPDEREMPGIGRIELLCDLEPGEPGINAAKVRRLRARICQQMHWEPQHANQLSLDEAADVLEGVQRVPLAQLHREAQGLAQHGLATIDHINVGAGRYVDITGLSCKVIAGNTPTACPDANPVLPPSMLPLAEQAVRRLSKLPEGTTVHWVGHDTGIRNRCRCHPDAPFAAPFDQHRWGSVAGRSHLGECGTVPSSNGNTGAASNANETSRGESEGMPGVPEFGVIRSGTQWVISGLGVSGHLPDLMGVANLIQLLRKPGQYIPWAELLATSGSSESRSRQPALSTEALRDISRERARLQREIEEAENEVERSDSQQRLDELNERVNKDLGIGRKARDLNNPIQGFRARIHGRLKEVYAKMREPDVRMEALAKHLESCISSSADGYIYDPPKPAPQWMLPEVLK